MEKLHHREWSLYLAMVLIACVLTYQGRHYIMQIHYNGFLLGLGAMSLGLVLLAWRIGGPPPDPGSEELDETNA